MFSVMKSRSVSKQMQGIRNILEASEITGALQAFHLLGEAQAEHAERRRSMPNDDSGRRKPVKISADEILFG